MPATRELPYPATNFLVDLGTGDSDTVVGGATHVELPEARIELVEYRNGNEKVSNARSLQTVSRYSPLIIRRGAIGTLDWYTWWNQFRNGDVKARRLVTVRLTNEDRSEIVMTWKFLNARPTAWYMSPLDALSGGTLLETLELSVERMEVE